MPRNARNQQNPAPEPPEGAQPCDTLNSDFCIPELGENRLFCFGPPSLRHCVTGAPESQLGREGGWRRGLLVGPPSHS